MCADGKRDMPFSLSMMTVTMALVMIAAMEMGDISQKAALTVVMSVDVSIDTEIISDLELYTYLTDHPDHSKFYIREPIRNRDEPIRYRHRDVENIRMKTGVYRGRGGHPPEILTALGYHTFNVCGQYCGHYHGQLTALCPLDPPSETASAAAVSFLGSVRLEHSQPRPTMTGPAESEERWVNRWGKWRRGSCPNPNLILIVGEEGFQARSAESEAVSL